MKNIYSIQIQTQVNMSRVGSSLGQVRS